MKIRKWVDFGQEIQIEIGIEDVRGALAECFKNVMADRLGEDGPSVVEVLRTFSCVGTFLSALTEEQISAFNDSQRKVIFAFLTEQASRYKGERVATETAAKQTGKRWTCRVLWRK